MDITTVVGVTGAFIILVTFILNQSGKWSAQTRSYDIANAVGSLILVGYAFLLQSIPFVILNGVWFVVSLRDVLNGKQK